MTLIERLRSCPGTKMPSTVHDICRNAADELERLKKLAPEKWYVEKRDRINDQQIRIAELEAQATELRRGYNNMREVRDEALAELKQAKHEWMLVATNLKQAREHIAAYGRARIKAAESDCGKPPKGWAELATIIEGDAWQIAFSAGLIAADVILAAIPKGP